VLKINKRKKRGESREGAGVAGGTESGKSSNKVAVRKGGGGFAFGGYRIKKL